MSPASSASMVMRCRSIRPICLCLCLESVREQQPTPRTSKHADSIRLALCHASRDMLHDMHYDTARCPLSGEGNLHCAARCCGSARCLHRRGTAKGLQSADENADV